MRAGRGGAMVGAMGGDYDDAPEDQAAVIQIELRLDGPMPAGIATAPGGASRGFTGWMGLMSAVDALSSQNGNETAGDDDA